MISFWFQIKRPWQFHWAVAAQSGKPIMRGGGQVIKRQMGTNITRRGRRRLLDSRRRKVHFCGASTCCRRSSIHSEGLVRPGYIEPSRSPGGRKESVHFHHRLNSPLWGHSRLAQGENENSLRSCYVVILILFSLSPDICARARRNADVFSTCGGVTTLWHYYETSSKAV